MEQLTFFHIAKDIQNLKPNQILDNLLKKALHLSFYILNY